MRVARRIVLLGVLAAIGAAWYTALPPRTPPVVAAAPDAPRPVRGAIHVHSNRSDGTGSLADIAAAAARAGLNFVIFTDHGDAARTPDPPQYRSGVLCIDAVEISTSDGHLVGLGVPRAPYPLGGEARDVVDDLARLGGFAIAAHPGSNKAELRWSDWAVPVGGVEWINGDSEWRDESVWSLGKALLTYPVRQTETLTTLLDRPEAVLEEWDALTGRRRVVAVAAADAHARIGLRSLGEPYDNGSSLHVPSYERTFSIFSNVLPGTTLTGDATADAASVLAAIRSGHVYSRIDGIRGSGTMSFTATDGKRQAAMGDVMAPGGSATLRVEVQDAPDARIHLLKAGVEIAAGAAPQLEHTADAAPGVYRVEVSLPGAPGSPPVPWMLSNPIYVGRAAEDLKTEAHRPVSSSVVVYATGPATGWTMETSAASKAALDVAGTQQGSQLALRYALGGSSSSSPYAAFAMSAGSNLAEYDRIVFTANAERPMRLSVQLREASGGDGERWHRSVFVDVEPRETTVFFDDLRPIGPTTRSQPTLANVSAILFVVDTVNTPLGGNGRIWIDEVKYAR